MIIIPYNGINVNNVDYEGYCTIGDVKRCTDDNKKYNIVISNLKEENNNYQTMVDKLYSEETDAMMIEESHRSLIEEKNPDFKDKTEVIYKIEIKLYDSDEDNSEHKRRNSEGVDLKKSDRSSESFKSKHD